MIVEGMPAGGWLPPEIFQDKGLSEKFSLETDLGKGGSGVVVGARHRELDQRVAIKFLWPGPLSPEALSRFRREARAANRIKSEHVVRIIDVSTTETGIPFIVMEYLEGVDLERLLLQCPGRQVPVADAIEFALQACQALVECHALGIVHRDLKPSNLFCVQTDDDAPLIKILDFGISKLSLGSSIDSTVTDPYRILGSPNYMSPEQFDSPADVDLRADIWALGVILYELVTGVCPFAETSVLRVWQKVRSEEPPPLEKLRRDVPAALTPVVMKCLSKDREQRYGNILELANALEPFAPERARKSLARILRASDARGRGARISDAPDMPRLGASSHAPTVQSVPAHRQREPRRKPLLVGVAALGVTLVLLYAGWRAENPATVAHPAASPAPTLPVAQVDPAAVVPELPAPPSLSAFVREPPPSQGLAAAASTSTAVSLGQGPAKTGPGLKASPPQKARPEATAPHGPEVTSAFVAANTAQAVPTSVPPGEEVGTSEAAAPAPSASASPSPMIVDIIQERKPR